MDTERINENSFYELLGTPENLGSLKHVHSLRSVSEVTSNDILSGKTFDGIILKFENRNIEIWADAEYDTILIKPSEESVEDKIELSSEEPWRSIINKNIYSCWLMLNNDGFEDGLQISFISDIPEKQINLQLIVIASQIHFHVF